MTRLPSSETFVCKRCGACCTRRGFVRLGTAEPDDIASFLGISPDAFIADYTTILPDRSGLTLIESTDGACVFYDRALRDCKIQPVKPLQCRTFPFAWRFEEWDNICKGARNA